MDLITIPEAEIYFEEHFLPPEEASELFNTLNCKCRNLTATRSLKAGVRSRSFWAKLIQIDL